MFIGHFAVAFAAKPAVPRTSLATLMAAAQLLDLIWPILVLLGVETIRIEPGPNPRVGLWTFPAATMIVEGAMFVAGVAFYARSRPARDRVGRWGFWGFVAFIVIAYAASLAGGTPPGPEAVAASALVGWALIPWIAWFDRHRGVAWQP
jgi:hypothetical protein